MCAGWCTAPCTFLLDKKRRSVGSIATLRPDDLIIHHHRGHGHTIAKGAEPHDDDGRVPGQGAGLLPRARRLDAHCRHPGRQPGRHRRRGRRPPDGGGHRVGAANAPFRQNSPFLLWRRGLERGRVPRVLEHGLRLEAAGRVYLRQQPVRHVDACIAINECGAYFRPRRSAMASPARRWTAMTCWPCMRRC